ncbi:MAG: type II secretion system minor pseudopilin GspI [Leptothrix sp. (in: b-proteobacteria)]
MTHPHRTSHPTSPHARRGMTLIEVLVALAIVAITLAAGLKAATALTANTQRLADTLAAQWCADNQLTELRLQRQFPPVGDQDFSCEQLGQTFRGQLVVRPTPNPNFRRVDARVANPDGLPMLQISTILPRS